MVTEQQKLNLNLGVLSFLKVSRRRAIWELIGIWLALRLLTSVWAARVSALHPLTSREQAIAIWPPSMPLRSWLERVFFAPWERWDTSYYLKIVERGYSVEDGTAQFHPLLAWLATPVAWLTGQTLVGLMLVSSLAGMLLLLSFERLARLDLDSRSARTSTLFLVFSPLAFVLFAPYTESLFLLWAVLCFWWARQGAWWLAGLAAAFAVLTRQQGVFLVLPLAWELWEASDRNWRRARAAWSHWLAVLLIPLALAVWFIYRVAALGDLNARFEDPQTLIYSLLISPSASKVVPVQAFLPPWQALSYALGKFWREPELSLGVDLVLGGGFLVLLAVAWGSMRLSYRIYALVITLVSFGYYTGPFYPYMGLPRHLLLAFPVFIGLGPVCHRLRSAFALIVIGICGMLLLLMLYVLEGWTP